LTGILWEVLSLTEGLPQNYLLDTHNDGCKNPALMAKGGGNEGSDT